MVKLVKAPVEVVNEFLNVPVPLMACALLIMYPFPPKITGLAEVSVPLFMMSPPTANAAALVCLNSPPVLTVKLPLI